MPNKKVGSKKKEREVEEEEPMSLRNNALHPTCIISEEDIEETAVIGQGFYATVKFGRWRRANKKPTKVAIKCIKEKMVHDHLDEILREANNMVKLEHDNIIKLYGICLNTTEDQPCQVKLVTEYASYGSLISVIQDQDEEHHSFFCQVSKLWEFACQIAKGMQYLHSKNLIHFDLAARNVLVVTSNKVRISDFGLSKVLCPHQQKTLLEKPLALAWCAPELFKNQVAGFATKGCDVWSYGVLLWELMSFGEKPWADLSPKEIMEQADNPHKRLVQPWACSDAIFDVMQECWRQEPGERPSFTHIIELLKKAKPIVAAAKNGYWTASEKELCFQQRTKLTIIVSYGEGKYRCQNDKAKVGDVNEKNIDFKATPLEITLGKPKISCPFDMRHTSKDEILKEHNTTGVFPVEVKKLMRLAKPKLCSSQVQTAQPADEISSGQEDYTPMSGQSQDVEESAIQEVKNEPPKRQSVPPAIPERGDLMPSSQCNTLPTRKRPVPKPRKTRPKSTYDRQQDSNLEWVIPADKQTNTDEERESSNEKFEDKEPFIEDGNSFGCARGVNGHGFDLTATEITPETKTRDEQANDEAGDVIRFNQEVEHENPTPPHLPNWNVTSQSPFRNLPFTTLPSPPATIERVKEPANQVEDGIGFLTESHQPLEQEKKETHDISSSTVVPTPTLAKSASHPEMDLLIDLSMDLDMKDQDKQETHDDIPGSPNAQMQKVNHSLIDEELLIDLDENTRRKQEKANEEDDAPPPLPPKDILSRSGMSGLLPAPLVQPPAPIRGSPAMQMGATAYSTLTHPSSHQNQYQSHFERPQYNFRPFPTPLPEPPTREFSFDDFTIPTRPTGNDAKPRSESEGSSSSSTAYGEEINEGIAKIRAEFPGKSKDACYALILEYQGDIERILKMLQVSRFTSVSEKDAHFHLGHCNWNVERTVNYILDKSK